MTSVALFPLQSGVFPDGVLQLQIFEVRYLDLIKRCQREAASFGVAWLAQGAETQVAAEQPRLFQFGCMVELLEVVPIMPTLLHVKCRGTRRFRLDAQFAGPYGVWQGRIEYLECDKNDPIPSHLQGLADRLGQLIARAQTRGLEDRVPFHRPYRLDEAGWVANRWAEVLPFTPEQKVQLLGEADPLLRLERIKEWTEGLDQAPS